MDIFEINRRRAVMKIPVNDLCRQAGVSDRAWRYMLAGAKAPRPATLAKLAAALDRCQRRNAGGGPAGNQAAYRAAVVVAAMLTKADARAALAADPAAKASANPLWLAAAQTRRLAFWIANGQLGLRVTDIARAAGVTKQAVSSAIRELEDDDDPDTRHALRQIEEVFG
jgi:hypothetical protein